MKRQRLMGRSVALLGIGAGVLAPSALAQDCPELLGRLPGPIRTVAVSDDYAYFGSETALMVADVSDPSAPRMIGEVQLPDAVLGATVSGDYAFVADRADGLRVIDISTRTRPVEVGFVDTPGNAWRVAVSGGVAYVADDAEGLRVIDISIPSAPVEVGFVDTPGSAIAVAIDAGYAYVADGDSGLRVIDVSSPSTPVEVGFVDTPNDAMDVAISGEYAYVAWGDRPSRAGGLRVIDISTPSAPAEVGFVDTPEFAYGVAVLGGCAYVSDGMAGLRVIDVSVPSAPAEAGFVDTPGFAYGVAVSDGHAHVADWEAGLRIIDVRSPPTPVEVGFLAATDGVSVAVSDGYAYVVDFAGAELDLIDVSTPSAPVGVGVFDTPNQTHDVAVEGGYAYLAAGDSGLMVIDVRTPSVPVQVGFVDAPGYAATVAVSGDHAYVGTTSEGLRVIDVSTRSAPVEVGFVDIPGIVWEIAVVGDTAYIAGGYSGLRVIDVSTPTTPVEVGFADTPDEALGVVVASGYAYVADREAGLRVIDVSVPSAPFEVGFVDTPGWAYDVAVSGGHGFVAWGDLEARGGGLRVIDVSTASAPVEVGYFDTLNDAWGVAISGDYVFVAALTAGLYVLKDCEEGPLGDGRECFIPAAAVAAGAQGAFFQTDVEINNTGAEEAEVHFQWLPRGEDNSEPIQSDPISLAAGQSLRYKNVLIELFSLGPDSLGALKLVASTESVIGMSRTYNSPEGETAGTFGQGLPAIRATEMIQGSEPQRIIFLSENEDSRANVGCVNGSSEPLRINIGVFDAEGTFLETKNMDLAPYSNNQINRIFEDYAPVNGYVDVWADSDEAIYYCYGSMLDNLTSDPTTILPQVPSADTTFIPAAALASGLEGSFFSTDVDLNNVGSTDLTYQLLWLPRGENNSDPLTSDTFSLAAGSGVRYANVLDQVFGLEPDQVGALAVEASETDLLAMSRTYNLPSAKVAGTFGQELPGIPADKMIASGVKKRIIFMNENDDVRANVGCQNGSEQTVRVFIELFNAEGESLETKTMDLAPWSNNQITRVFRSYSPVEAGYVDVWTTTPGATIYCYGSVLDNLTSDPTTVLPQ